MTFRTHLRVKAAQALDPNCPERGYWNASILKELTGQIETRKAITPVSSDTLTEEQIRNACPLTWVFKIKYVLGVIADYKSRMCAQGFRQTFGVNYNKTHAAVCTHSTFMCALNIAVQEELHCFHDDAEQAFLNAPLKNPILCSFPEGAEVNGCRHCWATNAVYGLKQAGHCWQETSHNNLMHAEPRLQRSKTDPCFYYYFSKELQIMICTNVDDYAIFTNDSSWHDNFIKRYDETGTKLNPEGRLEKWCGINLEWSKDKSDSACVKLHQRHEVEAMLKVFNITDNKPADTPMESNFQSLAAEELEKVKSNPDLIDYTFDYKSAIGSLSWFGQRTWPMILCATTLLASFAAKPTQLHVKAVKRVMRYMLGNLDSGIFLKKDPNYNRSRITIFGFTDSDWAADRIKRRSMSGYITYMFGNLISCSSKYHPTPCLSTMEAEYIGEVYCFKELLFLFYLLQEISGTWLYLLKEPIAIFGDNNAALKFAEEAGTNSKTKHIDLRSHWLRHFINERIFSMNFVRTDLNIADIFTKPLSLNDSTKFMKYISNADSTESTRTLVAKLTVQNELRHRDL